MATALLKLLLLLLLLLIREMLHGGRRARLRLRYELRTLKYLHYLISGAHYRILLDDGLGRRGPQLWRPTRIATGRRAAHNDTPRRSTTTVRTAGGRDQY